MNILRPFLILCALSLFVSPLGGCNAKPADKPAAENKDNKENKTNNPTTANPTTPANAMTTSGMGAAPAADAKWVKQPGAKVGDVTLCPTSMEAFTVTAESPSVDYEGQKVYFCCDGCQSPFSKDPAGSLAKINAKIDAASNVAPK